MKYFLELLMEDSLYEEVTLDFVVFTSSVISGNFCKILIVKCQNCLYCNHSYIVCSHHPPMLSVFSYSTIFSHIAAVSFNFLCKLNSSCSASNSSICTRQFLFAFYNFSHCFLYLLLLIGLNFACILSSVNHMSSVNQWVGLSLLLILIKYQIFRY